MELINVTWSTLIWWNAGNLSLDIENAIKCIHCHKWIETQPLHFLKINSNEVNIFLKCKLCKESFIWYARVIPWYHDKYRINSFSKWTWEIKEFSDIINDLSESFVSIYWEAEIAENEDLLEICWVWYRKSLEFLIKDFLIKNNPEDEEKIKNKFLWKCIEEYIDNKKIKEMAKRAVWLWNDETHYIRKWENKDLNDLKRMIDITVHYIIMEIESDSIIEDMN